MGHMVSRALILDPAIKERTPDTAACLLFRCYIVFRLDSDPVVIFNVSPARILAKPRSTGFRIPVLASVERSIEKCMTRSGRSGPYDAVALF